MRRLQPQAHGEHTRGKPVAQVTELQVNERPRRGSKVTLQSSLTGRFPSHTAANITLLAG